MSKATSVDRAVSSIFVLGSMSRGNSEDRSRSQEPPTDLASLTPEELGGIEYRALRVLLKVTIGMYGLCCDYISDTDEGRLLLWPSSVRCYMLGTLDSSRRLKVQGLPRLAGSEQDMVVRSFNVDPT